MQETEERWVRSLSWGDPLEEDMTAHSSILAWRIPRTEKPGGLWSIASQRVGHNWSNFALSTYVSYLPDFSLQCHSSSKETRQMCKQSNPCLGSGISLDRSTIYCCFQKSRILFLKVLKLFKQRSYLNLLLNTNITIQYHNMNNCLEKVKSVKSYYPIMKFKKEKLIF